MFRLVLASTIALLSAALSLTSAGDEKLKDYKDARLEDLGIELVKPKKDAKTGFVVAGKNATETIRKLTEINGVGIAALEASMRPGQLSLKGFLGEKESLLDVLALDNDFVVGKHGLTHQNLARVLHLAGALGEKHYKDRKTDAVVFLLHGQKFSVKGTCYRGYQNSPFKDDTKSSCDAVVENVKTGKKIGYSLLVPYMIERYGFYEGKGTPYRVEPAGVLEVFSFLQEKAKKAN